MSIIAIVLAYFVFANSLYLPPMSQSSNLVRKLLGLTTSMKNINTSVNLHLL